MPLLTQPPFFYSNREEQEERERQLSKPAGNNQAAAAGIPPFALSLVGIWGAAIILRLGDLSARNLWTDEAWVALAALAATPGEALTLGRSTPPFYTLAVWGLVQVFGGSEAILRSLSFAFGLGTVFLFWFIARRLASPAAALLGLTLVAVSPVLVYFSKELKQYSGDAFFAVLVVWLAENLQEHPGKGGWLVLALSGVGALGFSHGAVFVLPVILAVLWLNLPRSQRPWLAGLGALWGLAVAAFYVIFYRHQVDPQLVDYWAGEFPDFSGLVAFLAWLGGALGRYFHYFFSYFFSVSCGWLWGVVFTALGLGALARPGPRRLLLYWGGPLLLTLAAAALHRYPFMARYNGSRLLLFSAPWLYLLAAIGLTAILSRLRRRPQRWPAPALAILILITLQPLALVQEDLHPQANRQELKPLAAYLQSHLLPGDRIYVYYHAIYPFKYYFRGDLEGVCWGKSCVETNLDLPASGPASPRRLWLVAAHFGELASLRQFATRLLGPNWREETIKRQQNAALLLFVPQDCIMAAPQNALPGAPRSVTSVPLTEKACPKTPLPPRP
uniref:Glycosyltransferase RgtA/B/C/D-like domain-containing protein n=1 Tax=Desulfobacca acetoxidans TaxID=60893 RepID=A0A7C3UXT4_9BACT